MPAATGLIFVPGKHAYRRGEKVDGEGSVVFFQATKVSFTSGFRGTREQS